MGFAVRVDFHRQLYIVLRNGVARSSSMEQKRDSAVAWSSRAGSVSSYALVREIEFL